MTRVEKQTDVKEEITKMKGEMVKEMQRKTRKHRPLITCSIIAFALVIAIAAWIGWIVAGTGLVQVPLFTNLAYEKPVPDRVVVAGVPLEDLIETELRSTLTERLQSGNGELLDNSVQLSVSEDSLTATLRSAIEEQAVPYVDSSNAQVTVHEDAGLQIYLPIENNPQETALVISLQAISQGGVLELALEDVVLGSVSIPSFILSSGLEPLLNKYLGDLNQALASYATISDFSYNEGWVEISGEFAVEILDGSE